MGMQGSFKFLEFTNVRTNHVYVAKMLEKSTITEDDKKKIWTEFKFTELRLRHKNIVRY